MSQRQASSCEGGTVELTRRRARHSPPLRDSIRGFRWMPLLDASLPIPGQLSVRPLSPVSESNLTCTYDEALRQGLVFC